MRIFIKLTSLLTIMVLLTSCTMIETREWISVDITDENTTKVPKEWKMREEDGFKYFYMEDGGERRDVLVEYYNGEGVNPIYNHMKQAVNQAESVFSAVYSNSSEYVTKEIEIDGQKKLHRFIILDLFAPKAKNVKFLCVDDTVSDDVLEKIAYLYDWWW